MFVCLCGTYTLVFFPHLAVPHFSSEPSLRFVSLCFNVNAILQLHLALRLPFLGPPASHSPRRLRPYIILTILSRAEAGGAGLQVPGEHRRAGNAAL